jgi:hypothetical protein
MVPSPLIPLKIIWVNQEKVKTYKANLITTKPERIAGARILLLFKIE